MSAPFYQSGSVAKIDNTLVRNSDGTLGVAGKTATQLVDAALSTGRKIIVLDDNNGFAFMTAQEYALWATQNDGSIDPFAQGVASAIENGMTLITYKSDGSVVRLPVGLVANASGGTASAFSLATSSPSVTLGNTVNLLVMPTNGSWPNGVTLTPSSSVAGSFSPANASPTGSATVTFVFTPSATGTAALNASTSNPVMTSGGNVSVTVAASGGGSSYPALTLSNSPAFDTTSPLQGAASLSAGKGVMASGIVPPNGTQYVTLEAFIRTTAPTFGSQILRLDDASGHWMAAVFNQGQDNNNSMWHISPQSETYDGVPYSGTAPVSGQRCHLVLQTTSDGKACVWIDGVLNSSNTAPTSLSMTDALKATINVTSAGLNAADSIRLSAGRRYAEGQNFTPPTTLARDGSTMLFYPFDDQTGNGA